VIRINPWTIFSKQQRDRSAILHDSAELWKRAHCTPSSETSRNPLACKQPPNALTNIVSVGFVWKCAVTPQSSHINWDFVLTADDKRGWTRVPERLAGSYIFRNEVARASGSNHRRRIFNLSDRSANEKADDPRDEMARRYSRGSRQRVSWRRLQGERFEPPSEPRRVSEIYSGAVRRAL